MLGFTLAIGLYACQVDPPPNATSSPQTPPSPQGIAPSSDSLSGIQEAPIQGESPEKGEPSLPVLSPEAEALVTSVGPEGLHNPQRGDVRLVVISDLNGAYGSTDYDPEIDKAIALLPFWQPDMVVCSGDMIAGQSPTLSDAELTAMWTAFDDHVAAPLRQANVPYGFTIGNHDASGAKAASGEFVFERERIAASSYWNNPTHAPGVEFVDQNDFPFYYSFTLDDIFFLAWDGSSATIPQDKLAWVEQALSSPEAQAAKMKVLLGHLPLYAVAGGRDAPGEVMANADELRAMLERHQVHTYISGHHHAYYPGHKGDLQLLHTGLLGSGPRAYVGSSLPPQKALTVMDINFDDPDLTTYTTYDIETLGLIEMETLPRFINGHNGRVLRRDVAMDDLTLDDHKACEQMLSRELCQA